jgi:hypothetical protein
MATIPGQGHPLQIQFETKGFEPSAETIAKMEAGLSSLRRVTAHFPVAKLLITAFRNARNNDYTVKTSLVLMSTTLFTGDHDVHVYPAFERCVGKLVNRVDAYIDSLSNAPETRKQQKGTRQEVYPTRTPDVAALESAVRKGDYVTFRRAAEVYEVPVRDRVGRWVQRYPEIEARLAAADLSLDDIVEEVFLNAFERYDARPEPVRLGEWLEELIDLSVRALLARPEEEKENIAFARTLQETPLS